MKSYRARNLSIKCQIAKDDGNGNPLKDDRGNFVLDHGGLWFLKVSGTDANDNKRVLPLDATVFFQQKAKEVEDALRAEGITEVTISPEEVYAEYATTFTKPNRTYAPPGHPEEFSVVLPKGLCVNWQGGGGVAARSNGPASLVPQAMSLLARIRAARTASSTASQPVRKSKAG